MNGQLRLESEEGRGSQFPFTFNFPVSTAAHEMAFLEAASATPQTDHREMMYSVPMSPEWPANSRRQSNDSVRDRGSTNSGRSEIDHLVKTIATPKVWRKDPQVIHSMLNDGTVQHKSEESSTSKILELLSDLSKLTKIMCSTVLEVV